MTEKILEVKNVTKNFKIGKGLFNRNKQVLQAVSDGSFEVYKNKTLGVVGESGCGKSTTGKLIMRLEEPDEGEILFNDRNILDLSHNQMKSIRKDIQMIFQDPYASLNPQMTILETVKFSLMVHGYSKSDQRDKALEMLEMVGISKQVAQKYPSSLSGGQRQRVAIARALVLNPQFVVADEPVSALDKSIQAQVLNLLEKLKDEFSLSMIFISHDLNVIEYVSDYVMVMYLGKVVEYGPAEEVYKEQLHPYTQALVKSSPSMTRDRKKSFYVIEGEIPSPIHPPSGCRFRTRCPFAFDRCAQEVPELIHKKGEHKVSCFLYDS
ncbi:ABC transporter ATP-binding protein [Aquibacillus albus]|uniref:Oligopeptide/dipeptide ABC transporter ATP-binding protein n=1 Tax=Aquibacillus albus TaxID=1168171 RepID=A0ABS2N6E3_9BACI|nr:oligopeptide/dipeptide ABC transporter ATP-binding protein [Aquibacillus albus]MBM7573701.1 oligopeptide/dipeptide ABC transporter ATP-binding protein [Aquibacillus albus]